MQVKLFEVRDKMTFIPVVAVMIEPGPRPGEVPPAAEMFAAEQRAREAYLIRRCGYATHNRDAEVRETIVVRLDGTSKRAPSEWHDHGDRTMKAAHQYIASNWSTLRSGDVVDVEFILGETPTPKVSERDVGTVLA